MSNDKKPIDYLTLADLPPQIRPYLTSSLKSARQHLVEYGESAPVVVIHGDETMLVDAGVGSQFDKDILALGVRELVALQNAHTVVHSHEMWTLPDSMTNERKKALMAEYGAISRIPERIEQLMVNIECRDGRRWLARADIRRKGRAVTLGEPKIVDLTDTESSGRFAGWFAPEKETPVEHWSKT